MEKQDSSSKIKTKIKNVKNKAFLVTGSGSS
jgi:hypothetical protein